jgi:hypothetical protein
MQRQKQRQSGDAGQSVPRHLSFAVYSHQNVLWGRLGEFKTNNSLFLKKQSQGCFNVHESSHYFQVSRDAAPRIIPHNDMRLKH